jgi:hypothetical protein
VVAVQDYPVATTAPDINVYDYTDGSTIFTQSCVFIPSPENNPTISIAAIVDSPFFAIAWKFTIFFFSMADSDTPANLFPLQGTSVG